MIELVCWQGEPKSSWQLGSQTSRERKFEAAGERLRAGSERLRIWEGELRAREQGVRVASPMALRPKDAGHKVGRNELPVRVGPQVQALPRAVRRAALTRPHGLHVSVLRRRQSIHQRRMPDPGPAKVLRGCGLAWICAIWRPTTRRRR